MMGVWEGDCPSYHEARQADAAFPSQGLVRAVSESAVEPLRYLLCSIGIYMERTSVHQGNQASRWVLCSPRHDESVLSVSGLLHSSFSEEGGALETEDICEFVRDQ